MKSFLLAHISSISVIRFSVPLSGDSLLAVNNFNGFVGSSNMLGTTSLSIPHTFFSPSLLASLTDNALVTLSLFFTFIVDQYLFLSAISLNALQS